MRFCTSKAIFTARFGGKAQLARRASAQNQGFILLGTETVSYRGQNPSNHNQKPDSSRPRDNMNVSEFQFR